MPGANIGFGFWTIRSTDLTGPPAAGNSCHLDGPVRHRAIATGILGDGIVGRGFDGFLAVNAGHSNLTYLIRYGELEFVLRRPPLGPLAPTAHDMPREYNLLSVIHLLIFRSPLNHSCSVKTRQ